MAAGNNQCRGARLRLQAMQAQITAAFIYCSTAENALVLGRVEYGRKASEKARHTAQVVRAHLNEPNHVPADSVAEILNQVTELERRVASLEARLQA